MLAKRKYKRTWSGNYDCAQRGTTRRYQRRGNGSLIGTRRNGRSCDVNRAAKSVGHDPQREGEGAPAHVGKGNRLDGWQRRIHTERHQLSRCGVGPTRGGVTLGQRGLE